MAGDRSIARLVPGSGVPDSELRALRLRACAPSAWRAAPAARAVAKVVVLGERFQGGRGRSRRQGPAGGTRVPPGSTTQPPATQRGAGGHICPKRQAPRRPPVEERQGFSKGQSGGQSGRDWRGKAGGGRGQGGNDRGGTSTEEQGAGGPGGPPKRRALARSATRSEAAERRAEGARKRAGGFWACRPWACERHSWRGSWNKRAGGGKRAEGSAGTCLGTGQS